MCFIYSDDNSYFIMRSAAKNLGVIVSMIIMENIVNVKTIVRSLKANRDPWDGSPRKKSKHENNTKKCAQK